MTDDGRAADLEFGIILGDVPEAVGPREHLDRILRQVERAQENGFTYICIGQHFLYRSFRWPQPIPLLAHLAAVTDPHIKLVPSVLVVPFYHPVVLAEELATLDMVSGGRLVVGVGAGYRQEEFEWLQLPYAERYARLEEAVGVMQRAWSEPRFSFEGRFWQMHDVTTHLRPLQQPRPPLWFGAMGSVGIRRAARLGDAWIVTVETSLGEVDRALNTFDAERQRLDLPLTRIPIRREIIIGANQDEAVAVYESRARDRFLAYAERGAHFVAADRERLSEGFRDWALERAILGTADECIERLRLFEPARLGPVIVRPSWPGMSPDDVDEYIDHLGRDVVSAFAR